MLHSATADAWLRMWADGRWSVAGSPCLQACSLPPAAIQFRRQLDAHPFCSPPLAGRVRNIRNETALSMAATRMQVGLRCTGSGKDDYRHAYLAHTLTSLAAPGQNASHLPSYVVSHRPSILSCSVAVLV